jgi:uncharacterized protein YbaA (DUF1428 family)
MRGMHFPHSSATPSGLRDIRRDVRRHLAHPLGGEGRPCFNLRTARDPRGAGAVEGESLRSPCKLGRLRTMPGCSPARSGPFDVRRIERRRPMSYVDGYVLPVPKKNLKVYRRMAQGAGKVFRKHGALDYKECVGDDLKTKWGMPFTRILKVKPGETVIFSFVVYKSRAHRDRVNAKVMKEMEEACESMEMPFDVKRMVYGGFKALVDM